MVYQSGFNQRSRTNRFIYERERGREVLKDLLQGVGLQFWELAKSEICKVGIWEGKSSSRLEPMGIC